MMWLWPVIKNNIYSLPHRRWCLDAVRWVCGCSDASAKSKFRFQKSKVNVLFSVWFDKK